MAATPYPYPKETRETDILVGTGVAEYGPFGFKVFDTDDIVVLTKPAGQPLFSKVAATVSKVSGDPFDDFTVDFGETIPPETQFIVRAERVHDRQVAVTRGGAISTDQLEKELSKQGTVIEELRRDVNESVRSDYGSDGFRLAALPAGHFWKSDGQGGMVDGGDADDISEAQGHAADATAAAAAAIAAKEAAESAAASIPNDILTESGSGPVGLAVLGAETEEEARTAIGALSSDEGAVTRLNLSDELAQAVASTPIFFGAAADGTNDDAAKINNAIAALPNGGVLDGLGKTYRVDSTLVLKSGVTLRNITIDFSNAAVGDTLFEAAGALGTPILLTSNVSAKATSLPLASVDGLSEGDLIRVYCTGLYASNTNVRLSEMVRIKSISGTTVTLTAPLSYGYLTSQSAQVEKLDFVNNIKFEGVKAFGSGIGGEQIGGLFNFVKGLTITECKFSDFDTVNLAVYRSAFVNIHRTRTDRAFRAGYAYGISISHGCHWVNITECSGERVRHAVTIGGTTVNRFIKVANCNAFGNLDAGFDCHPAGDHIDFIDNYVAIDPNAGGEMDGIIAQGGNTKLIGNTVIGSKQWSVFHQCLVDYGTPSSIVANNIVRGDSSAFYGVYVVAQGTAALVRAVIQGNSVEGHAGGVKLHALSASINAFSIMGNTFYEPSLGTAAGILVEADGTKVCSFGAINGNSGRVAPTAAAGILLVADNSPNIQYVTVSGNSIFDGDYGCRGVNTDWINVNGNTFVSATTPVSVAGANSATANNIP